MYSPTISLTSTQGHEAEINVHRRKADMTGYLVHCANCYAAIIAYPPRPEYEIILVEPCPMDNGLEQSFSCDYCFHMNKHTGIKDISFQKSSNIGIMTD